jgi:hypothetical protein
MGKKGKKRETRSHNVLDVLSVAVRHKKGLFSACDWVKGYFP